MDKEMCVCGHAKILHVVSPQDRTKKVCMHDNDPENLEDMSTFCNCENFQPAEARLTDSGQAKSAEA